MLGQAFKELFTSLFQQFGTHLIQFLLGLFGISQ